VLPALLMARTPVQAVRNIKDNPVKVNKCFGHMGTNNYCE